MVQPNQYSLQLVSGEGAGERALLAHFPFTLGRQEDRDWVLLDKTVSRDHAAVVEETDGLYVVDRGSRSGTFVNGEKVDRRRLRPGDVIQLGSTQGPGLR